MRSGVNLNTAANNMRIIRKIPAVVVKRAFVTAQKIRLSRKKGKKYMPKLEQKEFIKKLNFAKQATLKLTEKQLDRIIANEFKKRVTAYNSVEWYIAIASPRELGVWRRAGGLPSAWTCCSLEKTAKYVWEGIKKNSKQVRARSKRAIPRIGELSNIIAKERCLFPIVFRGGIGTRGRSWCRKKVLGDIDDGCMRSIALTIKGHKNLKIYFGIPKRKK